MTRLYFPTLAVILTATLFSCETKIESDKDEDQLDSLMAAVSTDQSRVVQLEQEVDSLRELLYQANQRSNPPVDRRIQQLVSDFIEGWKQIPGGGKPDLLLKHFLPNHMAVGVEVDTTNAPRIVTAEPGLFKKRLKALSKMKDLKFETERPRIFSSEVEGKVFTVTFGLNSKTGGKDGSYQSHYVITLTGRVQDELRIGSFNWVEIAQL